MASQIEEVSIFCCSSITVLTDTRKCVACVRLLAFDVHVTVGGSLSSTSLSLCSDTSKAMTLYATENASTRWRPTYPVPMTATTGFESTSFLKSEDKARLSTQSLELSLDKAAHGGVSGGVLGSRKSGRLACLTRPVLERGEDAISGVVIGGPTKRGRALNQCKRL